MVELASAQISVNVRSSICPHLSVIEISVSFSQVRMAILEVFANRVRGADSHISIQASRMSLVVMCIPTNFRDALGLSNT